MEARSNTSLVPATGDSLRRANGRLAGVLFMAGAAFSLPSTLLLDARPAPLGYLMTVAILLIGAGLYFAPWSRMSDIWLHAATATGTVTVTVSLIVFSPVFRAAYFVVLAYAAYVFAARRAVAAHAAFAAAGLTLALAVNENGHTALTSALVFVPALFLVTALIAYLNEQLAASRDAYREFAGETIDLALRIRTSAGSALNGGVPRQEAAKLDELARAADELHLRPGEEPSETASSLPTPPPAEPSSARRGDQPARPRTRGARPRAAQPPRP